MSDAGENALAFKTQCTSVDDFVRRYCHVFFRWGLILKDTHRFETGQQVSFYIQLKDGTTAVRAGGVIERNPKLPERIVFRISSADEASRAIFERMLAAKDKLSAQNPGEGVNKQTTQQRSIPQTQSSVDANRAPSDSAASPWAEREKATLPKDKIQALENAFRRMRLLDESLERVNKQIQHLGAKKKGPIIGIDLGTTNSCCAIMLNGKAKVIPSRRGHNTIPSVVAINKMGDELVGSAAKAQMEINPERTIYGSKRLVGRPFDSPIVQQVRDRFHYKIVKGSSNESAVQIDDRVLSLEEVAARILTELRDTAQENQRCLIERAVITVPAFYNENQRQAVRKAGELAGFQIERILNEPTAAALTFGCKSLGKKRLLVYDLGGGTFDASVLELNGNAYEVLSTGGDTFLGGVDFDTQLMDHILIEFQLGMGKMPKLDRVAFLRVLQGAEFAKKSLSSQKEVEVRLPFIGLMDGKPIDLEVKVTQEQLESLVEPLIARSLDVCEAVLAERSLTVNDIDDILLVGGQTRMPLVWKKIQELFGKEPLKGVHPDESVAIGAALLGNSFDQKTGFELVDVLPMAIGIGLPTGRFHKIISAGTALPAARTYGMGTWYDAQTSMVIPIYQGESSKVAENELLGAVEINGIQPAPAGKRLIEVTYYLDAECLMTVSARESDRTQLTDVHLRANLSDELMKIMFGLDQAQQIPTNPQPATPGPASQEDSAGQPEQPAPVARSTPKRAGWWKRFLGLFKK